MKRNKTLLTFLRDKANKWTVIAATKNEYLIKKADQVVELEYGKHYLRRYNQKIIKANRHVKYKSHTYWQSV